MSNTDSARIKAVKLLGKTFSKGGYSNILLDKALNESDMDEQEKAFCSALYYGVLERKITLDYIISKYSKIKISKMNPVILNILRTGIYQLEFMDNVPDSAAVNESVEMAKKMRLAKLSGFVNAVMRSFIRDNKEIEYPDEKILSLSVRYSAPEWLVRLLCENYTDSQIKSLLESSVEKPPVTIKINNLKGAEEKILSELGEYEPKKTCLEGCLEINSGNLTCSVGFKKGLFHVQDIASQLCCRALNPKQGDIILDLCAAPGGKTFTIAELSGDRAEIYAFDIHEHRVKLMREGAQRLGISSINAAVGNAAVYNEKIPMADKILCDVPCSGLGVIRRKPEIKYKNYEEFEKLPEIQYNILENAAGYLKIGGELIYSTCTVDPRENGEVIDRFLREHKNFEGISFLENIGKPFGGYKATLFPEDFGCDGFFISKIKRME